MRTELLDGRLNLRLTKAELALVREQAEKAGLSVSEYARRRVFGRKVESKIEVKMLAELHRIGGLLKHVHVESGGAYSVQTSEAINNINVFIKNLEKVVL